MSYDMRVYKLVELFLSEVSGEEYREEQTSAGSTPPGRAGGLDPLHAAAGFARCGRAPRDGL